MSFGSDRAGITASGSIMRWNSTIGTATIIIFTMGVIMTITTASVETDIVEEGVMAAGIIEEAIEAAAVVTVKIQ